MSYGMRADNVSGYIQEKEGLEAIKLGLWSLTLAMLDVADAIREHTKATIGDTNE